ncbi:hypothetical protein NWE73_15070 [Bdellovibrio sp. PAP01]|uniref:Uncharacterized protein n=2 Tax=Bdellovibrio svalbardensis TaxID=2972972 RepID=A0ABT6DM24_9BACT|nr:hypothetical protein [Bdellovibrio svalbardensis]
MSLAEAPKICHALLKGQVIPTDVIPLEIPQVFYPNDPGHSRPAMWNGALRMESFISPAARPITCGVPYAHLDFGRVNALGTMPPSITTYPWVKIGYDGKPATVAPIDMVATPSDSYEYPLPLVHFIGESIVVDLVSPDGVSDICNYNSIPLPSPMVKSSVIEFDASARYWNVTTDGEYRWDGNVFGKIMNPQIEIQNPSVTIVCNDTFTYEAEFQWPYVITDENMGMLCPGSVDRRMKMHGEFGIVDDNKVVGYIDVEKPTVTSTGGISGSYSGESFSIYVEGKLYTDADGKKRVDLPYFKGGAGISWNYTWTCPFGTINGNLPAAASGYLDVIDYEAETESPTNFGHFILDADLDDQVLTVDKGGQGIVTFHRVWKKK